MLSILALLRALVLIIGRKKRTVPYYVRTEIKDDEQPYTVYYERLRTIEGLVLCGVGLYLVSNIYKDPAHTFDGTFIWYLIFGFVFLALGLPLCFVCSKGCAAVTNKRVIIYRTRCFSGSTVVSVPKNDIIRACRISAGRKGVVSAFFSLITSLLKGEKEKAEDMYDAAFLNGYLEVCTEEKSYKIRLGRTQAEEALNDIAQLCKSDASGGKGSERAYFPLASAISVAAAITAVIIFGFTLTSNARDRVEKQYIEAVYLQNTESYSQAYVEFEHLSERYSYRDSDFRSKYCYARLEMSQGNYRQAAERIAELPDFEEKNELLYHCALAAEQENSAAFAAEIYTSLGDYKDCADRVKLIDDAYNAAVKAYDSGDYIKAAEGFSLLRDYKETGEYVSLLCKEAKKTVPPEGNPEKLSGKEIVSRCEQAQTILCYLLWDSDCAALNALCEEYLSIYKFD